MGGILTALRQGHFTCFGPSGTEGGDGPALPKGGNGRSRPYGTFLERPLPESAHMAVSDIAYDDELLFRHFVDGSQRTTNAGHVVDPKHRYLPLLIAQIGVATTELYSGGCE